MAHKGMRDVPTMQAIHSRNQKRSREQMVTEFARLEHEKARLERELQLWTKKKMVTEEALAKVQFELDEIQQDLMPAPSDSPPRNVVRRRTAQQATAGNDGDAQADEGPAWREIAMEY